MHAREGVTVVLKDWVWGRSKRDKIKTDVDENRNSLEVDNC